MGNVAAFPGGKTAATETRYTESKSAAVWGTNTFPLPLGYSRVTQRMN